MPVEATRPVQRSAGGAHDAAILAALLRGAGAGILAVDRTGALVLLNEAAEQLLGLSGSVVIGTSLHALIHAPREEPESDCPLEQALRSGLELSVDEDVFRRPDGSALPVCYTVTPLAWDEGSGGAVVLFKDRAAHDLAAAGAQRLAASIAATEDAVIGWTLDTTITSWNPGAERLFGYTATEALGQSVRVLVPADYQPELSALIAQLRRGEPIDHREVVRLHKDGRRLDVVTSIAAFRASSGAVIGVSSVIRDITQQKRAERELQARARQQAVVAELGQRALAGADIQLLLDEAIGQVATTLQVEFAAVLELVPEAGVLMLRAGAGWAPELIGRSTITADPTSQAGSTLATLGPVIIQDRRTDPRFRDSPVLQRLGILSGASVPIPGQDRPFGTLVAHSTSARRFTTDDVHFLQGVANVLAAAMQRSRSEAQLRDREAEYRSIFEATTDGLLILDTEGTVVEANPAACALFGYPYQELIGRPYLTLIRPHPHQLDRRALAAVAAGETAHHQIVAVRKDGAAFDAERLAISFAYRGQPHVLAVLRDVTERVRAYELLEERVAERTRELQTLLDVSHNVASTLELEPLLGLILGQLKNVVEYTGAFVLAIEGEALRVLDYRGPVPSERLVGVRFAIEHAVVYQEVLRRDAPVIVDDLRDGSPFSRAILTSPIAPLDPARASSRSLLAVPLKIKDQIIGLLRLDHAAPHAYRPRAAALALAIANQAAVALENARLYARAQEVAALEERQRLARELHDSVTQSLYGVTMEAEAAARLLAAGDVRTAETYMREVRTTAQDALREMRLLIFELRPPELTRGGLLSALQARLAAVEGRVAGLAVSLDTDPADAAQQDLGLSEVAEEVLYRIAQEALNNAVKHARPSRVSVWLRRIGPGVVLEVSDDGAGFDLEAARTHGGFGLRSMQERAARVGASVTLRTAPGAGTTVRVEVPP